MSTGSDFDKQNADQMSDETFVGKGVDVAKAAKLDPAADVETRQESTKND